MLDIGWTEVLVISVVVLFVVGPRDIPKVLRTVGQWAGKIRGLAKEFRETVDDAIREAELDEVRKTVEAARGGFRDEIRATVDPGGELTRSLQDIRVPSESKKPGDATTEEEEDAPAKPAASRPARRRRARRPCRAVLRFRSRPERPPAPSLRPRKPPLARSVCAILVQPNQNRARTRHSFRIWRRARIEMNRRSKPPGHR